MRINGFNRCYALNYIEELMNSDCDADINSLDTSTYLVPYEEKIKKLINR